MPWEGSIYAGQTCWFDFGDVRENGGSDSDSVTVMIVLMIVLVMLKIRMLIILMKRRGGVVIGR